MRMNLHQQIYIYDAMKAKTAIHAVGSGKCELCEWQTFGWIFGIIGVEYSVRAKITLIYEHYLIVCVGELLLILYTRIYIKSLSKAPFSSIRNCKSIAGLYNHFLVCCDPV